MKPLSLSRPHLIVMIGIPGSGKSTFAERFSTTFNTPLVSHAQFQRMIFGTKYGSPTEEERAVEVAYTALSELLKTKQTVIYEDATGSQEYRQELAKTAKQAGYTPFFVWVQTDSGEAGRRALRKNKDTIGMSPELFEHLVERFNVPVASERAIVISGKHTYASQLKSVLKNLSADRADMPVQIPRRNITVR